VRSDRRRARAFLRLVAPVAAVVAVLAAGCQTPTAPGEAPAYDPTRLTDGRIYRWSLGATVAVYVDSTGQGGPGLDVRAAVERGLAGWRGSWRYDELRPRLVSSAAEADVVVQLRAAPSVVIVDVCANSIAIASGRTILCAAGDTARTLPLSSGGTAGHVKVAIEIDGDAIASPAVLDAIVAHELGHALGIGGHSADAADLMFAAPTSARPTVRDAATLRYVLHQPVALRL
jgi:hypothetical protein